MAGEGMPMCVGVMVAVIGMRAVVLWYVSIRITLRGCFYGMSLKQAGLMVLLFSEVQGVQLNLYCSRARHT